MITSYDGFCTILSFDQDELGVPFSSQPAQINSPRLLLRPDTKSKKKKKSSPKSSEKKNAEVENKDPQPNSISSTVSQPVAESSPVPMDVKESPAIQPCDTPKRQNGIGIAQKELLNNNHVTNSHVTNNHVTNNHVTNSHVPNNHVTPVGESDSAVKRITPVKVSDAQKSRESMPDKVVEISVSEKSDGVNAKHTVKPPRRIALTKIE